ncbi:MAG: DUF4129 domain-containing protein [Gemmatimonadaceae bacterium]
MPAQLVATLAQWPARAIHDTVAAIVQQDVYQRRFTRSLAQRFWAWLGDQLNALFQFVAATSTARIVTLALCVILVAAVALRMLYAARAARERPGRARTSGAIGSSRHPATLDEARRLARAGRFADAAHVLYAAVLDALATRRLVMLHPSKTSGDFARELRARGHPAYPPFRTFTARFDRVFYGYETCGDATFNALWGDAERLLQVADPAATR